MYKLVIATISQEQKRLVEKSNLNKIKIIECFPQAEHVLNSIN